ILDEPTASLTKTETEGLFELISRLKAQGISIIYISHRMEEIFEVADRITVMRDGMRVATELIANLTMEQVIEYIVGQKVEEVLVLDHSVKDNLLLPLLKRFQQFGLIDDARGDRLVQSYVSNLHIKTDSIYKPIRLLSGGNQQKVVIAKWLAAEPEILLMDEPTAGVDIGAKVEIVNIIRQLADSGKGVIVISSEFPELLAVSDRVLVLQNGTVKRQ